MRCTIVAVLVLAGCSSQAVKPVGLHQYMIANAGRQVFPKAIEACAKLGRKFMPLGIPTSEVEIDWGKQFKFECILDYEVVPIGNESYRITVSDYASPRPPCENCGPPLHSEAPSLMAVSQKVAERMRDFCAPLNKKYVVTDGSLDMGPGFTTIFRCDPPQVAGTTR